MVKHGLKTRLLRFLALRLRGWADDYLVRSMDEKNEAQNVSPKGKEVNEHQGGPPPDFLRRLIKGPPAHWLERVKNARPDLKVEEGEFLFPLQEATDQQDQQHFDQPPQERRTEQLERWQQPKPMHLQPAGPSNKTHDEMPPKSQPRPLSVLSGSVEETAQNEPTQLIVEGQAAVNKEEEAAVVSKPAGQLQNSSQTQSSIKSRRDDGEKADLIRVGGLSVNTGRETVAPVANYRTTLHSEFSSEQPRVSHAPMSEISAAQSNEAIHSEQTRSPVSRMATVKEDIVNRATHSRGTDIEQWRKVTHEQHRHPARTRATIEIDGAGIRPTPPEESRVKMVTQIADVVKTPEHINVIQELDNRWPELPESATDLPLDELLKAIREIEHLRKLDHEQRGLMWSE